MVAITTKIVLIIDYSKRHFDYAILQLNYNRTIIITQHLLWVRESQLQTVKKPANTGI